MGTAITNGNDVVSFLKTQHQQVKQMFSDVLAVTGEQREQAFYELRRMLAIHETAEEEIVHPAARRAIPDGDSIVHTRLREENEAKRALTELETLDMSTLEFETKFRELMTNVIAHAEAEETEEFDALAAKLQPKQLESMRKAVALVEKMAPTRPHAGIESAAANMIAGPFASMLDRARDAISGKSHKH